VTPADDERLAFARDARLFAMRADGLCRGWLAYDLRCAADGEEVYVRHVSEVLARMRGANRDPGDAADPAEVGL
jgi:hypothetical protein